MKFDFDIILILGPQGSGKGTQAEMLCNKLGFFHWDMGAILREEHEFVLSDGKKVGDIIDQGFYLTDAQLGEILERRISSLQSNRGVVFDGVPRQREQAKFLLERVRAMGFSRFIAILIDVTREESMKRLLLRREIEHRIDDTPEAITRRLDQGERFMGPLLEYLKTEMRVIDIDGHPSIPEVTKEIKVALNLPQ